MPFIKVYVHFVWSTKNREPFLNKKSIRWMLWDHIRKNALSKDIFIDCVSGYSDHCHCLVSMRSDQNIEDVARLIKGESSFWLNQQADYQTLKNGRFRWQNDYFAVSVSESVIPKVRAYIHTQEEHHSKRTFGQEYEELIKMFV